MKERKINEVHRQQSWHFMSIKDIISIGIQRGAQ